MVSGFLRNVLFVLDVEKFHNGQLPISSNVRMENMSVNNVTTVHNWTSGSVNSERSAREV